MGKQLHYATKWEIKYDGGFFNWAMEEVENLLSELGIEVDSAEECCPTSFECPKDSFKKGLTLLKKMKANKIKEILGEDNFTTKKDVVDIFKDILKNSAKTSDWIHFEWF